MLLIFQSQAKTTSFLGYPKVIPYIKFEHFGIIRFWVILRTNRQTNKQTDGGEHPTHADRFYRRRYVFTWFCEFLI